jgi:ABC-2 type transport system permease protein
MSILFTSMFSAISIIWDREFGFLKEVLVAPVPRWAVALGKSMGGATIAMIQSAILICMAPLAGISLSVLVVIQMLVLAFLISFAITSFFVAVASRMQSMQSFQVVMNFIVMPIYFLSGAMFPMSSAPAWMRSLMTLNPLTYGVDAFRNVIFSQTMISTAGVPVPLLQMAQNGGLVRWGLSFDLVVMAFSATLLAAAGAWAFSRAS